MLNKVINDALVKGDGVISRYYTKKLVECFRKEQKLTVRDKEAYIHSYMRRIAYDTVLQPTEKCNKKTPVLIIVDVLIIRKRNYLATF